MPQFARYIGIDYSGAETPTSSLSGLRVYVAEGMSSPKEILPLPSPRKFWTRHGVAEFLRMELLGPQPLLVGIDHAFSFPLQYFEKHHLPLDWHAFLDDFQRHWPTDEGNTYVRFVSNENRREARKRMGDPVWFRLTDLWTPSAKSVFQFNVQGQVATSTHAGLPWLRYLRAQCGSKVHFWPFEGWDFPAHCSVVAEVYPSLWMRRFPREGRNSDQHAAYSVAAWLQRADVNGWLARYLDPALTPEERSIAKVEGWILGVV